jgi:predicted RNA-binding protein YlqC (UPF0109 family)
MANAKQISSVQKTLEFFARELVDDPSAVTVNEIPEMGYTMFEIVVAPNDRGKVIGRGGKIANALRSVAKAISVKEKRRVNVDIAT